MAPSKFQIYVDQSMRQPASSGAPPQPHSSEPTSMPTTNPSAPTTIATITTNPPLATVNRVEPIKHHDTDDYARYKPEALPPNQRFFFDERKLYPAEGGEFSFEELNYYFWLKRQERLLERKRYEEIERENEELRQKLEVIAHQNLILTNALKQLQGQAPSTNTQSIPSQTKSQSPPKSRLSIVPQSLRPTQDLEYADMSFYGAFNDAPSVVHDFWKNTLASDKFTVPIDQSQFIRENCPTSTPSAKDAAEKNNKRTMLNNRRMSRPSMCGSPTLKLSPITETSRDCNSKSSSSSSAMSTTPATVKKPLVIEPIVVDEPDRPLDPNDPTTYRKLLKALAEPLDRRSGFYRFNQGLPKMKNGVCFEAGNDSYLVDKELSTEAKVFSAQLLNDDSDNSNSDFPTKNLCLRVDQPANEWLYYICNEFHRRLVRQKTKPDVELSVMNAEPAIIYTDGSILVDEYYRFVTLDDFMKAHNEMKKTFPKSVAAFITLELIQIVRVMHSCDILHMNINPKNIIIASCPNREDIAKVDERTSIVKLIGFDRAMDLRLLPADFKFKVQLEHLSSCEMADNKPWTYEVDWFGVLGCIHQMFFTDKISPIKEHERWKVDEQFKGFPTAVWNSMFDELLNIDEIPTATKVIDQAIDELSTWVKANLTFVLKEATSLDAVLENYCKATNKSIRT